MWLGCGAGVGSGGHACRVRVYVCVCVCVCVVAGMGIKGGIARKLLKQKYGRPEPPGQCDIDVLLFVQTYSPEVRSYGSARWIHPR